MKNPPLCLPKQLASTPISLLFVCMLVALVISLPPCVHAASLAMPQDSLSLDSNRKLHALLGWLDRQRGTIVTMQKELVSRPALNPEHGGTGEEAKLRWVADRLREYGITDFERLDYVDDRVPGKVRGNLAARLPGQTDGSPARRTLWLVSHLDVFPPGPPGNWKGDPFTLRVEGDLVYGRGVEDNHQAIVASLLLVESLRSTGVVPRLNIGLLFCSGALTNYTMNIGHVLDLEPDLFSPDDLILLMDYGSQNGAFIEVAEKTDVWLKFTVTGREGHASSPQECVNALAAGAAFIHALRGLDAVFPERNPLFVPPVSTFSPTMSENRSKAVNDIPGEFVFFVDARLIPEHSFNKLEQAMRDLAETVGRREGARIDFEVIERTASAPATPTNAPVVRLLGNAVKAQLGVEPEFGGIGGVTMASAIRERGFPVAVWGIQKNWRNKAEEYASIADQIKQAKVLARLLLDPEADGTARAGSALGGGNRKPGTSEGETADER